MIAIDSESPSPVMIQTLKSDVQPWSLLAVAPMNRVHTIGFHIIGKTRRQPIPEINTISLGTLISGITDCTCFNME